MITEQQRANRIECAVALTELVAAALEWDQQYVHSRRKDARAVVSRVALSNACERYRTARRLDVGPSEE